MEAGALLLLLLLPLGFSSLLNTPQFGQFRGISFTFDYVRMIGEQIEVNFNGRERNNCTSQALCEVEEQHFPMTLTQLKNLSITDSGCCFTTNLNGKKDYVIDMLLNFGTRSDTHTFNQPPITANMDTLRSPQNCFSTLPLLAYDPDGDHVRCRTEPSANTYSTPTLLNTTLDENTCTLHADGLLPIGVHVFELLLEDFPTEDVTLTFADGSSSVLEAYNVSTGNNTSPFGHVSTKFTLEILPPVPSCALGHVTPQFLSRTPSHGEIQHAVVGQAFHLLIEAQAAHASINNFQVSGPSNMTKVFVDKELGKAEVTLIYYPPARDLHRHTPICFTAETNQSQSEMRCILVAVTNAAPLKGKVIVTCSASRMSVLLEKASMPGLDKRFLQLSDPSCSLESNDTHIYGVMSLSTCGTTLEDRGDFIVFKNEIHSELGHSVITRTSKVSIGFSCMFPKTVSVSTHYQLHKSDYIFTESSFGSFGYAFDIFLDTNFTQKVEPAAYPVEVHLLDTIYMGIQAETALPAVTLFVESCKATPDDNPQGSLSYDLIQHGCVKDETLVVHSNSSDPTSYKFEVQAFKFNGNFEQVYITCSVMLCEPGNPNSRCAQGCMDAPARRRRRSLGTGRETASHYITQGPLRFVKRGDPKAAVDERSDHVAVAAKTGGDGQPENERPQIEQRGDETPVNAMGILGTTSSTIVLASLFMVTVIMLAVVIGYFARKNKPDDRHTLLASDSEK